MSKFQACLETYEKEFKKLDIEYDIKLLSKVTRGCGPSIYSKDAARVSSGDPGEIGRLKKNFLIRKLRLNDCAELDKGIEAVVNQLGKSNRNKYRPMFYYLLVLHFEKASLFK